MREHSVKWSSLNLSLLFFMARCRTAWQFMSIRIRFYRVMVIRLCVLSAFLVIATDFELRGYTLQQVRSFNLVHRCRRLVQYQKSVILGCLGRVLLSFSNRHSFSESHPFSVWRILTIFFFMRWSLIFLCLLERSENPSCRTSRWSILRLQMYYILLVEELYCM